MPVNTRFTEPEVAVRDRRLRAPFVFTPGEPLPDGEPLVVEDLGRDDLAAIFYTSGTTGFPKGAMTSHANFLANSENAIRCIGVDRDARARRCATLVNVPLFHVTGCNSQLLVAQRARRRASTSSTNPLDLEGFLRTVGEERRATCSPRCRRSTTR